MSENTYSHANTVVVEMTGEPFKGGREPPGGDDMEERVERLENDMSEVKSDLKTIMRDLSEMKGRLSAMPTTWQLVALVFAIMAGAWAIIRFGM